MPVTMFIRHFLILDSLTWDIKIRHEEILNINRYYSPCINNSNTKQPLAKLIVLLLAGVVVISFFVLKLM